MQRYIDRYEACRKINAKTDQRSKKHMIYWDQTLEIIHHTENYPKCQMPREFMRGRIGEYECINGQGSAFFFGSHIQASTKVFNSYKKVNIVDILLHLVDE